MNETDFNVSSMCEIQIEKEKGAFEITSHAYYDLISRVRS